MQSTKEQVKNFLLKCEELKSCKFIVAPNKISDLLKCIVNSRELYGLFDAVTSNFDYPTVKSNCLVTISNSTYERSYVNLPQTTGQVIAFIFCLLMEFENNTLNFNEFLRRYFPEDGSYVASYRAFCSVIIKSLQDAVAQVYEDELNSPDYSVEEQPDAKKAQLLSVAEILISGEIEYITKCPVPDEDKEGGLKLLYQLLAAIKSGDKNLVEALACGYNYFILYNKCISENVTQLFAFIVEFEKSL